MRVRSAARARYGTLLTLFIAFAHVSPLSAQVDAHPIFPRRSEAAALVRSTFATLNDANLTANYSVLRATAAPDFQARFSADELQSLFQDMRDKHVDLSAALALDLEIEGARFHTGQKILQLRGVVNTKPALMRFGFSYQSIGGKWKLYGLTLDFEASTVKPGAAAIDDLSGDAHRGAATT